MKRVLLAVGLCGLMGACTVAQQQTAVAAAAKLQTDVANGCLVVQPTLVSIQVVEPAIAPLVAANGAFCAASASVSTTTVAAMVNTTIPAMEKLVNDSPLIPAGQKPAIVGALTAFQIALSTAMVVYNQSQPAPVATLAPAVPS